MNLATSGLSGVLPYFTSGQSGTRPPRHALTLSQAVPALNIAVLR